MLRPQIALAVILLGFVCLPAKGKTILGGPVRASMELASWSKVLRDRVSALKTADTYAYPNDGYTECRETVEIPGAYLCVANEQLEMNSALARATIFVEGLGKRSQKGQILRHDNKDYVYYRREIGGHDLRGPDLLRFYSALNRKCQKNPKDTNNCANRFEKDLFESFLLPRAIRDQNFVVISVALNSKMESSEVVSHEIMHAQYFNVPQFRKITDDFWKHQMTNSEREQIRRAFKGYYDRSNELLMRNEFQAYILQAGAEHGLLSRFAGKYRTKLIKTLNQAGVQPVQINRSQHLAAGVQPDFQNMREEQSPTATGILH